MGFFVGLLLALPLTALCAFLVLALSKSGAKPQEPALTPRDLVVLQESAEEIVNSITTAADEAMRKTDEAMRKFEESRSSLEELIARAEKAVESLESQVGPEEVCISEASSSLCEATKLAEAGMDNTTIARQLNIGSGEVELLLNLRPRMNAAKSR